MTGGPDPIDPRFAMANERTYLAWIRTSLALIAGGVAAAKAIEFHHDIWRWVVAAPPIAAGALLGLAARRRLQDYADAMERGRALPGERHVRLVSVGLAVYAAVVLLASVLD